MAEKSEANLVSQPGTQLAGEVHCPEAGGMHCQLRRPMQPCRDSAASVQVDIEAKMHTCQQGEGLGQWPSLLWELQCNLMFASQFF